MLKTLSFLACAFCLSLLFGCAETDDPVISPAEIDESLFPLDENFSPGEYPDGWVKLTDADVEELRNLEIPPKWVTMDIPQEQKNKYTHATLLKQFGDIPEVRFIIESERNPGFEVSREFFAAGFEAHYRLFPTEDNRRVLEEVWSLPEAGTVEDWEGREIPPRVIEGVQFILEALDLGNFDEIQAELRKRHGNNPDVHRVVNHLRKIAEQGSVTTDEFIAYLEVLLRLEPDDQDTLRLLEELKKAKAEGFPPDLMDDINDLMQGDLDE